MLLKIKVRPNWESLHLFASETVTVTSVDKSANLRIFRSFSMTVKYGSSDEEEVKIPTLKQRAQGFIWG
jgi:hypothetical protein